MLIWALLSVLLVGSAVGTPLRGHEDDGKYGYQYDVRHPGGSSRVHVRSGSDRNRNFDPSSLHHGDYISDSTYNDPTYVGPVYRPNRDRPYRKNHYEAPPYGHTYSKVPVYEEHLYPRSQVYRSAPSYTQFPLHDRDHYGPHHGPGVISQSSIDAGSLYQKPVAAFDTTYSNPHVVQQVPIDEQISDKFEQITLEPVPIDQQVIIDQHSPIDQQVLVDEPAPLDQKILIDEQSPIDQQVLIDAQPPIHQKVLTAAQSPIDQQVIVDEQSPIGQKVIIDEQSPLDQQIVIDEPKEVILQEPVYEKPQLSQISIDVPSIKSIPITKGTPIVQQSSVDVIPPSNIKTPSAYVVNDPPVVQQLADYDPQPFSKKSPITQKTVGHPSQAIYDSPIEPTFSDVDRYAPPQSYKAPPRYRIVPTGPPYEKISHFTKIIHAPPRPFYPPRPYYPPRSYPQKHIKTTFPIYKKPPVSYSIKYPPPPPPPRPVTKIFLPPYSQKTINANVFTKNPPVSSYVKSPPPAPVTKTVVPSAGVQYHIDPPISQSIKLPPPPPITKSVKTPLLTQAQEHIDADILLVKNPPVLQSVKLPPPAPVTKTIIPHAQEHVDVVLTKNPPVLQSIKSPLPAPITKTLIPVDIPQVQQHEDAGPVTKTVVAAPVSYPQQHVDEDIIPQSVKLPPPPVTKSIASVKLPPPPVTKSVASVKLPPPPVTKSIVSVKSPPPPVTKSVIPTKQEGVDDDILSQKYPPISQTVKTSPVAQVSVPVILTPEQKYVDIPSTKNAPYSIKQPPVQVHQPVTFEKPTYVKEPFHGQKSVVSSQPKLPSVVSYFNKPQYTDPIPPSPYTVQQPYSAPPILPHKNTHYSDSELHLYVPSTKNPPPSHGVKYPIVSNSHSVKQPVKSVLASNSPNAPHMNPHFSALLSADDRGHDSPPSLKQPHSSSQYEPTNYPDDGPISKYTPDFDDGPYPESVHEEGFGPNIPPDSTHFDGPTGGNSPFDKYGPVSHAVRLPSPNVLSTSTALDGTPEIDGIGEASPLSKYPPVSHSVILPLSPKATPMPNLFAAVPSIPGESDGDSIAPKSEALIDPVSHSIRLPLPVQGNNYKIREKTDESKQKFPAFPVESALNHPDPVADKVAELTNSFTPGEPSHPESNDSNAPSIEEAKEEIERLNREIGRPFGSRLARRSNSGFVRIR